MNMECLERYLVDSTLIVLMGRNVSMNIAIWCQMKKVFLVVLMVKIVQTSHVHLMSRNIEM